jgi:hypothetical protein
MPPATARPRIRIVNRHRKAFRAGRLARPRQRRGNVLPLAGGEGLREPHRTAALDLRRTG